jgi:hypothetical protein
MELGNCLAFFVVIWEALRLLRDGITRVNPDPAGFGRKIFGDSDGEKD